MKKTIAKMMAAAVMVASLPAFTMPTFTIESQAAESESVTPLSDDTSSNIAVKAPAEVRAAFAKLPAGSRIYTNVVSLGGAYAYLAKNTTTGAYSWVTDDEVPSLDLKSSDITSDANVWKTGIVYYGQTGAGEALVKASAKVINTTLVAGTHYIDNTGAVDSIKTDANGEITIKFNASNFDKYVANLKKGTEAKDIVFYTAAKVTDGAANVALENSYLAVELGKIQVGETISTTKDTIHTGAFTADGFITNAKISIDSAGNATLIEVSTTDKKVNMLKQSIEVSEIMTKGVAWPVEKFDDKALKSAKMKVITAKNVKHLGSGCLRNCKKLRKARLGGSKMRKIHSNAFYDCEKLKNIKFNGKNLKAVGSKAFKKVKTNCTIAIKANTKKYNKVVKMIKKSGVDKVKFKKA